MCTKKPILNKNKANNKGTDSVSIEIQATAPLIAEKPIEESSNDDDDEMRK